MCFLEKDDLVPLLGKRDRGRRAGGTTANDEHVALALKGRWRPRLNVHRPPLAEQWPQVSVGTPVGPPASVTLTTPSLFWIVGFARNRLGAVGYGRTYFLRVLGDSVARVA